MSIYVQNDLFRSAPGQDGLNVNTGRQDVCDVGVPNLVWRHLKVYAIHNPLWDGLFSKLRCYNAFDLLPVDVPGVCVLVCSVHDDMLPELRPLCSGERATVPIGNHIGQSF